MITDQDCFRRAARRFVKELEAENRSAASVRVDAQQAKEERGREKGEEKLLSEAGEVA